MLGFYLTTVIIWMIVIYSIITIFKDAIKKKVALLEQEEKPKKGVFARLGTLFVVSAVPILRVFIAIGFIYIAICTDEQFQELMDKAKKND